MGETHFLDQISTQNPLNCPKLISREVLAVKSWLAPQNDLINYGWSIYVYPSVNRKWNKNTIFCFLWPYDDKIAWFSIKFVDPSKWPRECIYYRLSTLLFFLFFFSLFLEDLYIMKFQKFPYYDNYMSY